MPTPEGSGLLAQRNLQVTTSDNPGPASAHRVPQTFAVKPSAPPPSDGTARRTARRAAHLLGRHSGGLDGADLLARRLGGRGGHARRLDVRRASAARRRPAYDRGHDREGRHLRADPGGHGGGLRGTVQHRLAADRQDGTGIQRRGAPGEQEAATRRAATSAARTADRGSRQGQGRRASRAGTAGGCRLRRWRRLRSGSATSSGPSR